jgi:hypothetical protein
VKLRAGEFGVLAATIAGDSLELVDGVLRTVSQKTIELVAVRRARYMPLEVIERQLEDDRAGH